MAKIGKIALLLLILLTICVNSQPVRADTSVYVFGSDQSNVIRSGGIAGLQKTFSITGQFRLTINSDAGVASFEIVDANLTDETGSEYGQSLDEIFNMTGLAGTVVDDTTIQFEGKTADGTESDVSLTLTFREDLAHLTGKTTPPPNSADMFFYDVNAVAIKKYAGGTGEPNNPYQIATAEDLMQLGNSPEDNDKHFILMADIDLDPNLPGRKVFDKAVIGTFTGIFDGNGHVISNLWIKGFNHLGLFGQLASGAKISNLGLESADVDGTGWYVGGLVGENYGSITTSYSTGIVTGVYEVGGLVGRNSSGSITTNYSTGAVTGGWSVGGLVGGNWRGSITTSYSTGMVTGNEDVGGLVGGNYNGSITLSLWDIETSGLTTSSGGTGKTTAEMQTASTFLEAGWDFVDETDNGTEDIWSICEGTNYPRFVWQIAIGDFVCPDGITMDDFLFFMEHWLDDNCDASNDYCEGTDLDQSGTVDVNDLEIFFENWPDK